MGNKLGPGRIPSLDGLRAISIGLVILWHFNTVAIPGLWRVDYGNLGVRVFFVISGFLITTLLAEELQSTKSISLSGFYARRFARIVPAYWLYAFAIALLVPIGVVAARYRDFPPTLLYLTDYVQVGFALGATWSLSVEEQFYLIWPALIRGGVRRAKIACLMALIAAPIFRVVSDLGIWPTNPRYAFESVCDALATGCLLALLREQLWASWLYRRLLNWRMALALPMVALSLLALNPPKVIADAVGISSLNVALAVGIDYLIRNPRSLVGRTLNSVPFVWVGGLSYSLYLWQQPFADTQLPAVAKLAGALSCACGSCYLLERPVRRKLNAIWSRYDSQRRMRAANVINDVSVLGESESK